MSNPAVEVNIVEPISCFEGELCSLINKFSKENDSNTPDFILRNYLVECLNAFNKATNRRTDWYKK